MKIIPVTTKQRAYDVLIGKNLLKDLGALLRARMPACRLMLVTDDIVEGLYASAVEETLAEAGFSCDKFIFPHGEHSKSLETFQKLLEALAAAGLTRTDRVLALGGGVTGDLAGYAAASYLRGIPYVQAPTTLLAMVDSSVGGKCGVNLRAGKNLAGAFWQPDCVICDTGALATLPAECVADGMAEIIKYAMLRDEGLFRQLQNGPPLWDIEDCVARCVEIKARIVAGDECDHGERQLLNLGHTVGHALEKLSDFSISHGHAVAIGMVVVTRAAEARDLCPPCLTELLALLRQYDLPTDCPYPAQAIAQAAMADKKRGGDTITLVIPRAVGNCVLYPLEVDRLEEWVQTGVAGK